MDVSLIMEVRRWWWWCYLCGIHTEWRGRPCQVGVSRPRTGCKVCWGEECWGLRGTCGRQQWQRGWGRGHPRRGLQRTIFKSIVQYLCWARLSTHKTKTLCVQLTVWEKFWKHGNCFIQSVGSCQLRWDVIDSRQIDINNIVHGEYQIFPKILYLDHFSNQVKNPFNWHKKII